MNRLLDIIFAIAIILLFSPFIVLFLIVIPLIYRFSPLYFQKRIGRGGENFICIKFQVLKPAASEEDINDKIKDMERSTKLGKWMRNRGIDEIPQTLNVLIGNMSFVGPRPLLSKNIDLIKNLNPELMEKITYWQKRRETVAPGISGWHQIHTLGTGILKYDLDYLENPSIDKRFKIFVATLFIFIIGKDRYFERYPTGLF